MKVLLINLPGESLRKPEEHCGLAFLKSYLDMNNIYVEIFDAYAKRKTLAETINFIESFITENMGKDLYICVSPFVTSHESFVVIGERIKRMFPKVYIIVGGHYASLNKEYLLKTYDWIDAIIVGEGEVSLYELLTKPGTENIPGVYKRQFQDHFVKRDRIVNLDDLPFQSRYLTMDELEGQPLAITTSRGCYGECSFCSISSFYKLNGCIKQTYRSARSVSNEIHQLVKKFDIKSLKIVDDNFFRGKSDVFLTNLIELTRDLNIKYRLSARPNDITKYRAQKLKELGATVIGIGAESAHRKSLELFNKGIDISYSDEAIEILSAAKITTLVNFIMFNPIIDIDGLLENCLYVEKHMEHCLFHRINSHLWIRSTDPIVDRLVYMGLCDRKGFPYIECRYQYKDVVEIKELFDIWCNSNMKEYYKFADILMAKGIKGNEETYFNYKKILIKDVDILKTLILLSKNGLLKSKGMEYIIENMEEPK